MVVNQIEVHSLDSRPKSGTVWRTIALHIGYLNTTRGNLVSIATIKTPHTRSSDFAHAIFLPNDRLGLFSLIMGTISILIAENIPICSFESQKMNYSKNVSPNMTLTFFYFLC